MGRVSRVARCAARPGDEASFTAAVEAELAAAQPLRDNAYKVPLARNLAVRLLCDLALDGERR